MRIAFIGIGGVGGYFGGKLAKKYALRGAPEITFIARGDHLKAIQQNGLRLLTSEGDDIVWPNIATDHPKIAGLFDLVFFCVKHYALESSAQLFKENIKNNAVVITLQNGIDNAEKLQKILTHADVVSGSVHIISHIESPGVIRQEGGACRLTFGTDDMESTEKYAYIQDVLTQANIKTVLTGSISEALWNKFLLMCPLASITTATGKTYGEILADEFLREKTRNLMKEVAAVAAARRIMISEQTIDSAMDSITHFGFHSKTSMQLDREKGRPTEMDSLTGFLCRAGRESGIPTPLHDEMLRLLS